jgi:ribosomal-protein-alanine N-acetyltransferase
VIKPPLADFFLRPVERNDFDALKEFLDKQECILHHHLDWHTAIDWIGSQPFWILGKAGKIVAALACPPDPPGLAWIRLFAVSPPLRLPQTWNLLFKKALEVFAENPPSQIASLALKKQYANILLECGFTPYQNIAVLERTGKPIQCTKPLGISLRPMCLLDLNSIVTLDEAAFEPLWHNSLKVLSRAFEQSTYATVVELNNQIVAYQISAKLVFNAHLARIAVHPGLQKKGIATYILCDLIAYFAQLGIERITLNTQNNNQASLALYHKTGFRMTGEKFPVFLFNRNDYKSGEK